LPPEEYDRLRQLAPVAIGGVVTSDPGGQASLRVEHVLRGSIAPGAMVTVVYPLQPAGPAPIGGAIYYRPFSPGSRLMVYGQGAPVVYIVDGGIDVLSAPPPRASTRGGCASCSIGDRDGDGIGWLALVAALAWRRRRALGTIVRP
jgi:MYXO-CTERM domain-containing protein